ncbi:MAG TPA: TetR/AcrR family transcriptional regulator [Cytophagales bacterium]|nr:TetR/AcrR family transcriptional regulator [Cytophagales bacterium]HAA17504.1 TetR/AcrR family transcriptional regulator [Cytophagales bacterium]HAP63112.1 TetR/AcrR family transcriptional regulator [Cytophagales bacterium]
MAKPKQFNEEEVLDKVMHLFWEKGYSGTSMQDLVNHTGLSRSSIYDTFDGKDQLFTRVLRKYMVKDTKTAEVLAQIEQGTLNSWTYLYNFVDALAQEAAEDSMKRGCFAANTTAEVASCSKDIVALLQENQTSMVQHLTEVIRTGQRLGELNAQLEAEVQARYLFMFMNGLRLSARLDNTPEHLEATVTAAMQGLRPAGD